MKKSITMLTLCSLFSLFSANSYSAPPVTGQPIIAQYLGKLEWPQDTAPTTPSLTQLYANDINDLHGDLSCELIISTPGNYHMALKDAMYGRPDLGHIGLLNQLGAPYKVSVCWTTSPSIAIEQIKTGTVQFKNIKMLGRPALAVAPGATMDTLIANGQVDPATRQSVLSSRGNVILIRADKIGLINSICDLGGATRVVTPPPQPGGELLCEFFGNAV